MRGERERIGGGGLEREMVVVRRISMSAVSCYSNVAPRARVFTRNLPAGAVFLCSIAREHEVLEGDTAEKNSAAGRFLVNTRASGAT